MTGDCDSRDYLNNVFPLYFDPNQMEKKYGGKRPNIEKDFFPPRI